MGEGERFWQQFISISEVGNPRTFKKDVNRARIKLVMCLYVKELHGHVFLKLSEVKVLHLKGFESLLRRSNRLVIK